MYVFHVADQNDAIFTAIGVGNTWIAFGCGLCAHILVSMPPLRSCFALRTINYDVNRTNELEFPVEIAGADRALLYAVLCQSSAQRVGSRATRHFGGRT